MLGPSTPFEFGMARMMRQLSSRHPGSARPPWCDEPCPGRPPAGLYTGTGHVHHHCWACGREILTRAEHSYECGSCGVSAGPPAVTHPDRDFDPEFAATHSSPA